MGEITYPKITRDALHAISAEFLSSDKLRTAPLSEKKDFLRLKGLSDAEIDSLLRQADSRAGTPLGLSEKAKKKKEKKERKEKEAAAAAAAAAEEEKKLEESSVVPRELKEVSRGYSVGGRRVMLDANGDHRSSPPAPPPRSSNNPS